MLSVACAQCAVYTWDDAATCRSATSQTLPVAVPAAQRIFTPRHGSQCPMHALNTVLYIQRARGQRTHALEGLEDLSTLPHIFCRIFIQGVSALEV